MKHNNKAFSLIELSIVILVIGILIAGVTQASRLLNQAKLSTAETLSESSPVSGIKDLSLWLNTTTTKSFLDSEQEDGADVSVWYDLNPQSNRNPQNFSQSTDGSEPSYVANGINGLPALEFTSSEFLEREDVYATDILSPEDYTVFMVLEKDSGNGVLSCWRGTTNDFKVWAPYSTEVTLNSITSGGGVRQVKADFSGVSGFNFNAPHIVTIINRRSNYGGTTYGEVKIDGGIASNTSTTVSALDASLQSTFYIGHCGDTGESWSGKVGEVVIYQRALKNKEIEAIESYLGQKWGVVVEKS